MTSTVIHSLRYRGDSAELLRRLSSEQMPLLLDSGGMGRFDILSASPAAWVCVEAGKWRCSDPEIPHEDRDIFRVIRQLRDKYLVTPDTSDPTGGELPFHTGLIGYLGYPLLAEKALLTVADAFVGVYHWAVIVDHVKRQSRLLCNPACSTVEQQRLLSLLDQPASAENRGQFNLLSRFQQQQNRKQYDQAFQTVKDYISAGDCYQVNLSQQFRARCAGDPLAAYLKLRQVNPAPFSAYINWGSGALLSLSPERFLRKQGNAVSTQPIKGTRPRGENSRLDRLLARQLLESEKDRAENLMIVDLLRNDLGAVCRTGSVKVDRLFELQSFSSVHHLVSTVSAELAAGRDAVDLLASCFPGGSITGAPKLRAMEVIRELEPLPRQSYCGTAFYLDVGGNLDSNITIRSLHWKPGEIRCWAGGGIVSDSECELEYEECFHKINTIIKTLEN